MLSAGVLAGVVVGVALSLVWLVYVATRPAMPLLGREPGTQVFRDLSENPDDETFPVSPCCGSTAGCSSRPPTRSRTASAAWSTTPQLRAVVLDLEGVNFVDSQGAAKLAEITSSSPAGGVTFRVARLKPQVLAVLRPTASST